MNSCQYPNSATSMNAGSSSEIRQLTTKAIPCAKSATEQFDMRDLTFSTGSHQTFPSRSSE